MFNVSVIFIKVRIKNQVYKNAKIIINTKFSVIDCFCVYIFLLLFLNFPSCDKSAETT